VESRLAWHWNEVVGENLIVTTQEADIAELGEEDESVADAAFIAAARTDVPRLVAEIRRLQALLDGIPLREIDTCRSLAYGESLKVDRQLPQFVREHAERVKEWTDEMKAREVTP
jgi:hypothetical protein